MTLTTLTLHAVELGTYFITATFTDETAAVVTPTTAAWKLTDTRGNVVNGRSSVAITPLDSTFTVTLSGNDLAIGNTSVRAANRERVLTVFYTYNSTLGTAVTDETQIKFEIDDMIAISDLNTTGHYLLLANGDYFRLVNGSSLELVN